MSTAHELVDAVGIRDSVTREIDTAYHELPGCTLIQTRGNTGEHGIIYKDDSGQGTYLMIGSSWCFRSPMKGQWSRVGEVRDFVVLARGGSARPRGRGLEAVRIQEGQSRKCRSYKIIVDLGLRLK